MRVTEKGQVTIPKHIRGRLGIRPGSEVEFVPSASQVERVVVNRGDGQKSRREVLAAALRCHAGLPSLPKEFDGKQCTDWLRGPRDDVDARCLRATAS